MCQPNKYPAFHLMDTEQVKGGFTRRTTINGVVFENPDGSGDFVSTYGSVQVKLTPLNMQAFLDDGQSVVARVVRLKDD